MPFYEYECEACGHYHEAMQKMTDKPLTTCPACGKSRLVRLVSAPQFRLKGGGWYETDFKGDKDRKRNLADTAEPAAKAEDSAEGKPRVKPPKLAKPAKPGRRVARKKAGAVRKTSARKQAVRKAVAKRPTAKRQTGKRTAASRQGAPKSAAPGKSAAKKPAARPK